MYILGFAHITILPIAYINPICSPKFTKIVTLKIKTKSKDRVSGVTGLRIFE
jgi:hypothetical protein